MSGARIAVLAGDGPAAVLARAARDALDAVGCETSEHDALAACREADAVLLGPADQAAALATGLGLHTQLRPARVLPGLVERSPLRADVASRMSVLVMAPRAGAGEPGALARLALEAARRRRGHVTWLGPEAWREALDDAAAGYEDVVHERATLRDAAGRLAAAPAQLDVLLCDTASHEVLAEVAAALTGTPQALPAGLLGSGPGVFHPVRAHPLGAFLAAAMLLRHGVGMRAEAARVERAVEAALASGLRTPDLATGAGGERPANTLVLTSHILSNLRSA